jgi:hypothetical protein
MTLAKLIMILIAIESSGDDSAIGDNGLSYGCLQISSEYVQDANQQSGENWVHEDAFSRHKSVLIVEAYMARYATEARLGHPPTIEDVARIHNGGPNGWRRSSTDVYWEKVKQIISREQQTIVTLFLQR